MEENRFNKKIELDKVEVQLSGYGAGQGTSEYHMMLSINDPLLTFQEQVSALMSAYDEMLAYEELAGAESVFRRYFLSDVINQADLLLAMKSEGSDCAVSLVQQAPLNGTKVAMWCYLVKGGDGGRMLPNGLFEFRHGAYRDLWSMGNVNKAANSEYQTRLLLGDYVMHLNVQGCRLASNCVRTWFFVQDIDHDYAGVVKARNEVFKTQDLTSETHFIASTGIGGGNPQVESLVMMDAFAIDGIQPGQMHYLYARTHLNPTYEYGVSFERGSYIDYADRRKVYISGTASINNKGEIMYKGDVCKQTDRMIENVQMLLQEAECTYADVDQMIVYLRDPADYLVVRSIFEERFPAIPKLLVHAFVCRPGWLVEMECVATKKIVNQQFAAF